MIIGIVGLGLIGGSIAKIFKKKGTCNKIIAFDKNHDTLIQAYNDKNIDEYSFDLDSGFKDCNIIFICTPVKSIINVINKLKEHINDRCILTDTGSTKNQIIDKINKMDLKNDFIGGHPMAGSEKKGYEYSNDVMLENAYYILTPAENSSADSIAKLKKAISSIGSIVLVIPPEQHDYITGGISHMPHVIASALVNTVKISDNPEKYMHLLAAGGFRDITRIASSSPEVWESICLSNKENIISLLKEFEKQLNEFKNFLSDNNKEKVSEFFKNSKIYRDSFEKRNRSIIEPVFEFYVSVEDKPGIIADIAVILAKNNINIKNIGIIHNREGYEGVLRIEFYDDESLNTAYLILKDMNYTVHNNEYINENN